MGGTLCPQAEAPRPIVLFLVSARNTSTGWSCLVVGATEAEVVVAGGGGGAGSAEQPASASATPSGTSAERTMRQGRTRRRGGLPAQFRVRTVCVVSFNACS
ncbi:hypothetical protein GCM10010452_30380 [Crossiella cryophila]